MWFLHAQYRDIDQGDESISSNSNPFSRRGDLPLCNENLFADYHDEYKLPHSFVS